MTRDRLISITHFMHLGYSDALDRTRLLKLVNQSIRIQHFRQRIDEVAELAWHLQTNARIILTVFLVVK